MTFTATITSLGQKGEGVAEIEGTQGLSCRWRCRARSIEIDVEGDRGTLVSVTQPVAQPHRAILPAFRRLRRLPAAASGPPQL